MAVKIILTLPDNLVESAQGIGEVTQQDVRTVSTDAFFRTNISIFPKETRFLNYSNLQLNQVHC